jgi:hypothetical protein
MEIGNLRFPTKAAAVKHFQGILYRHNIGIPIPEPDASELGSASTHVGRRRIRRRHVWPNYIG